MAPLGQASFLKKHPNVTPSLFVGLADSLCSMILTNEIEFALLFSLGDLSEGIAVQRLKKVKFLAVMSGHAPFSKEMNLIACSEAKHLSTLRKVRYPVADWARKNGIKARIAVYNNSLTAHKNMVMAGMGVSLLPHFMVERELETGLLKTLPKFESVDVYLKVVTKVGKKLSPAAEVLLYEVGEKLI